MTLYFTTTSPGIPPAPFTVSIANADQVLPAGKLWTLSLRSELSKVNPATQGEEQFGHDLTLNPIETNDRYTTFRITNNAQWASMRDNFKDGIYVYQIGWIDELYAFTPYMTGVAKVITKAGQDPTKDVVSYQSNNEDNSGFVYYSDTL